MSAMIWIGLWSALSMLAPAGAAPPVLMAQDDDWQFAEDTAQAQAIAAVPYENGTALKVQCSKGRLDLVITGMPTTTETSRRVDATRSDGGVDTQVWGIASGNLWGSVVPSRDVRFLRTGGMVTLRSSPGQVSPIRASFDLPAQHANLDRVLTVCGYALTEDRDLIPRAESHLLRGRSSSYYEDREGGGQPAELSCIVRSGAYRECRVDHAPESFSARSRRFSIAQANGLRVDPARAAANEGKVVYMSIPLVELRPG